MYTREYTDGCMVVIACRILTYMYTREYTDGCMVVIACRILTYMYTREYTDGCMVVLSGIYRTSYAKDIQRLVKNIHKTKKRTSNQAMLE